MVPITRLERLVEALQGSPKMCLAVAAAEDPATIHAVSRCVREGLIGAVLIGEEEAIRRVGDPGSMDHIIILPASDEKESAQKAVGLVREGKAQLLMKGLVGTTTLLKAVLDKTSGLVPVGGLLTHVAVMEVPTYAKLLLVSDAAIIPNPTMDEKVVMLNHAIAVAHALGLENPKAALISAAEKINFRLQSSIDAAVIKAMAERHQIVGAIVDGPLALDVSISKSHCRIKGLESPIDGEADILIFPNIETANTFYKSVTILAHGKSASVVMGSSAPIVLSSRADDDETKYYSIILAALLALRKTENGSDLD